MVEMVTGVGIEPTTRALKVRCSTTELPSPERDAPCYPGATPEHERRAERSIFLEKSGLISPKPLDEKSGALPLS